MKRIIIVEDSYLIRQAITAWLEPTCKVHATDDVHQAMALLDEKESDWLVINTLLAKNSGLELLYEVNTWPDLRVVKTILLTHDLHYWQRYKKTLKELNVVKILSVAKLSPKTLRAALGL